MKARCSNPNLKAFKNYGGRGITVCKEWQESYEVFIKDMGRRPSTEHSLDRKKNDLGYNPNNCRWVTRDVQNSNHRGNHILNLHGKSMNIQQWCHLLGLKHRTVRSRLQRGWSIKDALEQ
jgi:hypothetical protein